MATRATTVAAYLSSLSGERRRDVERVRDEINRNLPSGYEEGIRCGILAWSVPPPVFPTGYATAVKSPLPFVALSARTRGLSVAFLTHFADPDESARFEKAWRATGERFDAGAGCVRFDRPQAATLRLIGEEVARTPVKRYVACYAEMLKRMGKWEPKAAAKPAVRKRAAPKAWSRTRAG